MSERCRVLDANENRSFRTIYEAINWCVGTDYRYWGRACWPNYRPTDGFRMWFTQLAHIERGTLVPSINDCLNLLCSDGNYFVFDYVGPNRNDDEYKRDPWYDLIFTKDVGEDYVFRGVFVKDDVNSALYHHVSKRIATKVKLLGCPARRLELLDSIGEDVVFDKDYLKNNTVVMGKSKILLRESPIITVSKPTISENKTYIKPVKKEPHAYTQSDFARLYPKGCRVRNKVLGKGVIKEIDNNRVKVLFDSGEEKSLLVDVCIKMDLLERI